MKHNTIDKFVMTLVVAVVVAGLNGCSSKPDTVLKRVDADKEMALTDRWNDEDSRLVARAMVKDMLSFPWMMDFRKAHPGKQPTIVIHQVRNKSHEHIPVDTFINDLKRAVIQSGEADFVVGGEQREMIREELRQQELHASESTRMEMGEEQGANFALSGVINSIVDQVGGTRVSYYQVDLTLVDLQSTREVWNGQKKIKKYYKREKYDL
jgi:hypothetical protein